MNLKLKTIRLPVRVETYYIDDLDPGLFPLRPAALQGIDIESFIFQLKHIRQVEVIVLRALGYTTDEIVETLGYKHTGSLYQLNLRIKRDFQDILERS